MTEEEFKKICSTNGMIYIDKPDRIIVEIEDRYGTRLNLIEYFKKNFYGWHEIQEGTAIIYTLKDIRSLDGYLVNFECGLFVQHEFKQYTKAYKFERDVVVLAKKIKQMRCEIKKTEILWDCDNEDV